MELRPDRDAFAAAHASGRAQVVWAELIADQDTAVSLMLKLTGLAENSFMLESVTGGEVRGRYSVLGFDPDLIWRCRGEKAELNRRAAADPAAFEPEEQPTLASLRALIAESRIEMPDRLPPMAAGLFGYLGYDTIRLVEKLGQPNPDPLDLADAMLVRPRLVAVVDNIRDTVMLVTPVWPDAGVTAEEAWAAAAERLEA
ncbi:MAG TPA: anthranilate synthase component I, partial [Thermohalobaculum sp.]|nr:anthranilate synthase component I [Thermohalobaculum sp.]